MKKLLFVLGCLSLGFSGCAGQEETVSASVFTLPEETQQEYKAQIEETLNEFYWYYDSESFSYSKGRVPEETEEMAGLFAASADSGYDLSAYAGRQAVVYTVALTQFNHTSGGNGYFYFVSGQLAGAYHTSADEDGRAYSLQVRNPFTKGTTWAGYETDAPYTLGKGRQSSRLPAGFCASRAAEDGSCWYLSLGADRVQVYRSRNGSFSLQRSLAVEDLTGFLPLSAAFTADGGVAVLVGHALEQSGEGNEQQIISDKAVFFDPSFRLTEEEILFTGGGYSCALLLDGETAFMNETAVEVYQQEGDGWTRTAAYPLGVGARAFCQADLDGDGTEEYLFTDYLDLYVYRRENNQFRRIWRTDVGVESFSGFLYTGDLNGDGIKEVYLADNTGTAIRYVLTENGFLSRNEDISYQQQLYVDDFNQDGRSDVILSEGAEDPVQTLYLRGEEA